MTPKEKAEQLIDKMYNSALYVASKYAAKQCALIAVDEIMKTYPSKNGIALYENQINDFEYWQQVKTEIENL